MNRRQVLLSLLSFAIISALPGYGVVTFSVSGVQAMQQVAQELHCQDTAVLPGLRQVPKSKAIQTITELGLNVNIEEEYSDQVKKGLVVSPDKAEKLPCDTTVTLIVSKGPAGTTPTDDPTPTEEEPSSPTPTATATSEPTATATKGPPTSTPTSAPALPTATNTAVRPTSTPTTPPPPTFTHTPPPTPTPDTVVVPGVVGMDSGAAEGEITARGLAPQVVFGGSNCQIYAVVGQEPAAGSAVARGSGVTLTVCPAVTVPDVRGINKDTAAGTLQSAGLTPVFAEKTCDGSKPSGQVWTTEPGAGAAVSPGTTVTVFFYEGCGGGGSSGGGSSGGGDFNDP